MTEAEYTKLENDRVDLRLPHWENLLPEFRTDVIEKMTVEELIGGRTAALIARDHPNQPLKDSFDGRFNYV